MARTLNISHNLFKLGIHSHETTAVIGKYNKTKFTSKGVEFTLYVFQDNAFKLEYEYPGNGSATLIAFFGPMSQLKATLVFVVENIPNVSVSQMGS